MAERFFNTTGPVFPAKHYSIPPLGRLDFDEILRGGLEAAIREGVAQTLDYVDRCRTGSGHLVVFDRAESKPWDEKLYRRGESLGGRPVTVWGV